MLALLPAISKIREFLFDYSKNRAFFISIYIIIPIILLISLFVLITILKKIKKLERNIKHAQMKEISRVIQEGAEIYLKQQRLMLYKLLGLLSIPVGLNGLNFLDNKILSFLASALIFMSGSLSSLAASYIGMKTATRTNILVVESAIDDPQEGFKIAYYGGMITGILNIGMFVFVIWLILLITKANIYIMVSFNFGASLSALLSQVGGGIYTKSADMGADLVGKYELSIREDDPRNPAIIADLVGDNVGDCAGRGADLFESASSDVVGGMLLGLSLFILLGEPIFIISNLILISLGLLSLYFSTLFLKIDLERPSKSIWMIFGASALFNVVMLFIINLVLYGKNGIYLFLSSISGLSAVFLVILVVSYYTSIEYRPTKDTMESSELSPSFTMLSGLANGFSSVFIPILLFCASVILAFEFGEKFFFNIKDPNEIYDIFGRHITPLQFSITAGIWGINLASVASDLIISTILSFDTFGPIMDNAAGISEMAKDEAPKDLRRNLDLLDSIGNTTKAIAKGFALICGGLSSIVMFLTFLISTSDLAAELNNTHIPDDVLVNIFDNIRIFDPFIILGFAIGVLIPVIFSSYLLRAVKDGAMEMVREVKDQFESIPGLKEGAPDAKPNYERCIQISSRNALKSMVKPVLITISLVIVTGILFGPVVISSLLIGNLISCIIFGFYMSIAGGSLDNAKKGIEDGRFGGKGSFAHKSSIIGDTVGDPLKDLTGPSMNILITTINTMSITFLPIFITTGIFWSSLIL